MKIRNLLFILTFSVTLSACLESDGIDYVNELQDINVAASVNGAKVTASFNSDSAKNLIDKDEETSWISEPDSPIIVEFDTIKSVYEFTILVSTPNPGNIATTPDVLIELSANGIDYFSSGLTKLDFSGGGVVACPTQTKTNEELSCTMNTQSIRFIRITSQNGKSFEFKELQVMAKVWVRVPRK